MPSDKIIHYPVSVSGDALIPSWATDERYDQPGEPWDSSPTKKEPGAGMREQGWQPDEAPAAQHMNLLEHQTAKWLQYLSAMQQMNWLDGGPISNGPGDPVTGHVCIYDEGIKAWIMTGFDNRFCYSFDGQTFSDKFISPVSQSWMFGASKPPSDAPTHTGPRSLFGSRTPLASSYVVELTGAFTWNQQVLPAGGNVTAGDCIWDSRNQQWHVGGRAAESPDVVSFWYDSTNISGFTQFIPDQGSNSTQIVCMAHGLQGTTAKNVAIGDGSPFDVYVGETADDWTPYAPGLNGEAVAIMRDSVRGIFILLTRTATVGYVYSSTNGATWNLLSTYSFINSDDGWIRGALDWDRGGLYVAGSSGPSAQYPTRIYYSVNGGVTWRPVAVPNSPENCVLSLAYNRFAKKFLAIRCGDSGPPQDAGLSCHSFAVGESLWDAGNNLNPPTVIG